MLSKTDGFCQYSTLWKAAVVCAAKTVTTIKLELPQAIINEFGDFLAKYNFTDRVVSKEKEIEAKLRLPAGEGSILLDHLPSE